MKQVFSLATGIVFAATMFANADPIEGTWKTTDCTEPKVTVTKCGSKFCVDVADGEYAGKRSGKLSATGGNIYAGKLKQFSTGITFTGTATLSGNKINMVAKKFGVTVKKDKWCR